ncbi:MAG: 4a-hydroxytetrahydrobiopterin dehydratase [Planctomycetota bacterium]|jgi:pterin-4a-carbinolamine dehydratase
MKQTPELDRAQANMQPGEMTLHGFLGTDDRKLVDILEADRESVYARWLTHEDIAARLRAIMEEGRDLMERELVVEDRFDVTVRDDRGLLPCPFGDGTFEKGDCHLHDPETDTTLLWNELSIHLIEAHGFYSGTGSLYRLDPTQLIDLLNIQPRAEHPSTCAHGVCGGLRLTPEQIETAREDLNERWSVTTGEHLVASFSLPDFAQALAFTNDVGGLAEEMGHHPDIYLAWGKVKIELWTHRVGGLTESDFNLAEGIDALQH